MSVNVCEFCQVFHICVELRVKVSKHFLKINKYTNCYNKHIGHLNHNAPTNRSNMCIKNHLYVIQRPHKQEKPFNLSLSLSHTPKPKSKSAARTSNSFTPKTQINPPPKPRYFLY